MLEVTVPETVGGEGKPVFEVDAEVPVHRWGGVGMNAADPKAGRRLRVPTRNDVPRPTIRIEALDKDAAFEKTA